MLWLDPAPLQAEIGKAYRNYHTHGVSRVRTPVVLWLAALNAMCRLANKPVALLSGFDAQRRHLRKMYLGDVPPGRLLEIGCGGGRYLNRMRRAGWQVEGIEPDLAAASRVRDRYSIEVRPDLFAEHYPDAAFDAVVMSHVIEHVHDPLALMRECRRVLRPNGFLVVTTPNARSAAHMKYARCWRGLEPPRHIHLFAPEALRKCAEMAGFETRRLFTTAVGAAGMYRSSDKICEKETGLSSTTSESISVLRSWLRQYRELRDIAANANAGQNLVLIAARA